MLLFIKKDIKMKLRSNYDYFSEPAVEKIVRTNRGNARRDTSKDKDRKKDFSQERINKKEFNYE